MEAENIKRAIWDRVERHVEAAPVDGINAEGDRSDRVADVQQAYRNGLRAGRLAAISAVDALAKTDAA